MTVTESLDDRLDERLGALEADIARLAEQMAVLVTEAEHQRRRRATIDDLARDLSLVSSEAMAGVTDRLDRADRAGYFRFAVAAAGVADRVVTNFDEHDVEQLGDNVVAMLEAFREVTRPDMLAFLSRMIDAVHAEQAAVDWEPEEPPGLWAIARQLRDPDVRRGLARALHTLRAVAVETGPHADGHTMATGRPETVGSSTAPSHDTPSHDMRGDVT
jgi:uncharacterized protein YjgD (DUF1641 family)